MYFVFILLSLKLLESRVSLHISSVSLTLSCVSLINIMLFQIAYIMVLLLKYVLSIHSLPRQIKQQQRVDPGRNSISTKKCFGSPPTILTRVLAPSYISLITLIYATGTHLDSKHFHKRTLPQDSIICIFLGGQTPYLSLFSSLFQQSPCTMNDFHYRSLQHRSKLIL